jgi:hypothetical protein
VSAARLASMVLLLACGDDSAAGDGGAIDARVELDASSARGEAGRLPDARRDRNDPDGNTSPEDAVALAVGGEAIAGTTATPEDYDYFRVDATEGQYVAIAITSAGLEPFALVPTITLLSPDLVALLSSSDMNGCGVASANEELVTRIAESGSYVVELHSSSGHSSEWSLQAVDLSAASTSLVVGESGAQRVTGAHSCVLGAFETAGDEDAIEVDLEPYTALYLYTSHRHGSTGSAQAIELVASDGTVHARTPPDFLGSLAVLVGTREALRVRLVGPERLGDNDHYLLRPRPPGLYGPGVGYVESEESANDDRATPEEIDPGIPDDSGYLPWFVLELPEGDADHLAFDAASEVLFDLRCESASLGSAVRALELRLLAADGSVLATAIESRFGVAELSRNLDAGRHVVRVSAGAHEPSIESVLVGCTVTLSPR